MKYRLLLIGALALAGVSCTPPKKGPSKQVTSLEESVESELVQEKHECGERTPAYLNLENVREREFFTRIMDAVVEQYPIAKENHPHGENYGFPYDVWVAKKKHVGSIELGYDTLTPDPRIPNATETNATKKVMPLNVFLKYAKCEKNSGHLRLDKVFFMYGFPWGRAIDVPLDKFRYIEQRLDEPSTK